MLVPQSNTFLEPRWWPVASLRMREWETVQTPPAPLSLSLSLLVFLTAHWNFTSVICLRLPKLFLWTFGPTHYMFGDQAHPCQKLSTLSAVSAWMSELKNDNPVHSGNENTAFKKGSYTFFFKDRLCNFTTCSPDVFVRRSELNSWERGHCSTWDKNQPRWRKK